MLVDHACFRETVGGIHRGRISETDADTAGIRAVLTTIFGGPGTGGWDTSDKWKIFDYVAGRRALTSCCRNAATLINWHGFDAIRRLRNKTIHAPNGVSRGDLESIVSLSDLACRLREIVDAIYGCFGEKYDCFHDSPAKNPYPVLKREMLNLLSR